MDRPHSYLLGAAVAAIAIGFTICAAAAERVEHVATQTESALTALGDASFKAGQYSTAEASYAEALRLAEQHDGLQSERVIAPLLGLGKTLAVSGHHQEAVLRLQRAVSLMRAQYGLFDLRQQDALKTLADSLTALDRVPEAQELMIYRVRVAEKAYGEATPKVIPSLCDLGDWFSAALKSLEARMTFQTALNIVGTTPALSDPIIVEPLRGIARTRMRAQSYPPSKLRRASRAGLNREGEEALKRAVQIVEEDPNATTPQTRIETLIQMGDWYQIKKSPREALPYYERASQLIRAAPGLPGPTATALDIAVRVYYPTPEIVAYTPQVPPEETQSHHVQLKFTVAADGSVRDARIVDHDTRDRYAHDILDAMRAARFRPKFVDGEPVATPGITYREVFWTGKPRT